MGTGGGDFSLDLPFNINSFLGTVYEYPVVSSSLSVIFKSSSYILYSY